MAAAGVLDSVCGGGVDFGKPAELGNHLHGVQLSDGGDMDTAACAESCDYGGGCRCGSNECIIFLGLEKNFTDGA